MIAPPRARDCTVPGRGLLYRVRWRTRQIEPTEDFSEEIENESKQEPDRRRAMSPQFNRRIALGGLRPRRGPVVALAVLAVAQVVSLGLRPRGAGGDGERITIGHDVSAIAVDYADGTVSKLGRGRATLLLVFDPDCPHSRRVASEWSLRLGATAFNQYRVLAISPKPLSESVAYAREQGWPVQVGSVEGHPDWNRGRSLVERTPWVFAVNQAGRVVAEGHGSKLRELALAFGLGDAGEGQEGSPSTGSAWPNRAPLGAAGGITDGPVSLGSALSSPPPNPLPVLPQPVHQKRDLDSR